MSIGSSHRPLTCASRQRRVARSFRKVSAYGTRAFLGVVDIVEVAANERKSRCRRFYPAAATLTGSRERGALDDGSNSFWPRHIDGMASFAFHHRCAAAAFRGCDDGADRRPPVRPLPCEAFSAASARHCWESEWYFWRCFPRTPALPILFGAWRSPMMRPPKRLAVTLPN